MDKKSFFIQTEIQQLKNKNQPQTENSFTNITYEKQICATITVLSDIFCIFSFFIKYLT